MLVGNIFYGSLLLQIICIVHLLVTGRNKGWIFVIAFLPYAGSIAYVFLEILNITSISNSKVPKAAKSNVKVLIENYKFTPTFNNTQLLGKEYIKLKRYEEGIKLLESSLTGIHKNDLDGMISLAQAYYKNKEFIKSNEIYQQIKFDSIEYRHIELWIDYAKVLEELKEFESAKAVFKKLNEKNTGLLVGIEYADFCKRIGNKAEAIERYKKMLSNIESMPKSLRKNEKKWEKMIRTEIKKLEV